MENLSLADLVAAINYTITIKKEAWHRAMNGNDEMHVQFETFSHWHRMFERELHQRLKSLANQ